MISLGILSIGLLYGCGKTNENRTSDAGQEIVESGETIKESKEEVISEEEENDIVAEVTKAAATYRDLYVEAEKGEATNAVISEEAIFAMAERMAEAGYTVTCDGNDRNMDHWEVLDAALLRAQQGDSVSADFYSIAAYGGLHYYHMDFADGELKLTTAEMDWSEESDPYLSYLERITVYRWEYTEKGWLIWEKEPSKNMEMDRHSLFRIKPLDDTARMLCKTYIEPIGYAMTNLFLTDWSAEDCNDLALNDTYGIFYFYKNGENPPYESQVPALEWETLMTEFLPFSVDTLKREAVYEEEQDTYEWKAWGYGSGMAYPSLPFPEVVSWKQEEDQIWILEVEGVSKEEGMDCAFAHEVTIEIQEDGNVRYCSNHLIPEKKKSVPRYQARSEN